MHDEFLCVRAWCDVKGIVLVVGMQGGEEKMSCGGGLAGKGRDGHWVPPLLIVCVA